MAIVVGAAIVHDRRVLAARRATPPVGGWELPGGKVEPGEGPADALAREIAEELGCRIVVRDWLDGEVPVRSGLCLRVAWAELVEGEPVPREHDAVRWLRADQLGAVDWLPADRPFVEQLRARLAPRPKKNS